MRALATSLREHEIAACWVDAGPNPDLRVEIDAGDLVVLGPKSPEWFEWGTAQERLGAVVVPSPSATGRMRDRMTARELLLRSGLAIPPALAGTAQGLLHSVTSLSSLIPAIVKRRNRHGVGVFPVRSMGELTETLMRMEPDTDVVVEGTLDGVHRTVYLAGDQVLSFDRPPMGDETTEVLSASDDYLPTLSIYRFRQLSGMLFGKLDVVCASNSMYVVDVGVFPKFLNVPRAEHWMATAIVEHLRLVDGALHTTSGS